MKDRIKQLMEAQHMNQQAFALCTGLGTASLSSIFTGRTRPTLNHVDAILEKFPNVNPMWLLKGVGGMFLTADEAAAVTTAAESVGTASSSPSPAIGSSNQSSANLSVESNLFNTPRGTSGSHPATTTTSRENTPSFRFETGTRGNAATSPSNGVQQQHPTPTPPRRITEIRVFYDDQTWESFTPKK